MGSTLRPSLLASLGAFTYSRLVVNTVQRMIYPFLAIFASGLNVPVGVISLALAVSMTTSAMGPFLAPIADRRGRKTGMLIGMGIFMIGMLSASIFPSLFTFFLAIILGTLGNNVLLPPMQAYLGDHTPYEKRGFYLAFIELSWALSFVLLVPLIGLILERAYWHGPFIFLSIAGAVATLLIWRLVPADPPRQVESLSILKDIKKVFASKPAVFAMLMGLTFIVGNEMVNVMFGVWMQETHNLQIAALGLASVVIGFSELGGNGIAAFLADRIGKERAIVAGFIANGLGVITLPLLGTSQVGAFIWLVIFFMTFEVALISTLPLMTEIIPQARATMMALFIASLSLGRAIGDVFGPLLYTGGMWINALACFAFNLAAIWLLTRIKINPEKSG